MPWETPGERLHAAGCSWPTGHDVTVIPCPCPCAACRLAALVTRERERADEAEAHNSSLLDDVRSLLAQLTEAREALAALDAKCDGPVCDPCASCVQSLAALRSALEAE